MGLDGASRRELKRVADRLVALEKAQHRRRTDPGSYRAATEFRVDSVTATEPGNLELTLSMFPTSGSLHVYWNGVWQPPSEWTLTGNVITIPDPGNLFEAGDVFDAAYACGQLAVAPAPVPSFEAAILDVGDPVLWAPLGEAAGTSALDATDHARHGTYGGVVGLGQPPIAPGLPGTAVDFAGTGWVDYGVGDAWQRPPSFSAMVWAQPHTEHTAFLFGCDDAGSFSPDRVWKISDETAARVYSGSAGYPSDSGAAIGRLAADEPTMLFCTFDGATLKFYKDGGLVQTTAAPPMNTSTLYPLTIGATANGRSGRTDRFDGLLQHAVLWDVVATAGHVAAIWEAGAGS